MPKTRAAEVIKAAEKARRADRRVSDAQRALTHALKARSKAEAHYLQLVRTALEVASDLSGKEGTAHEATA